MDQTSITGQAGGPTITLRVLGGLDLRGRGDAPLDAVLAQPKRVALLAYLAVAGSPQAFHRRDTLLGLLWPELDEEHARGALSQALHQLRQALGNDALLNRGAEEVGLSAGHLWCDAAAFYSALADKRFERALELYRGELLPGFHVPASAEFDRWLEGERVRARDRACRAALAVAERAAGEGNAPAVGHWVRRAAELARHDEVVMRRLIVLLDREGDRAGALTLYDTFVRGLGEDLEVEPAPETRELVAALRRRAQAKTLADHPAEEAVAAPDPRVATPRRKRSAARTVGAAFAAAVIVTLVAALALGDWRGRPGSGQNEVRSIAVLPLDDLSPEEHRPYFADGMTEALIAELSRVAVLDKVISRTSVMHYKATSKTIPEVARELGVDAVVDGSVVRAGARVRVTARLIHGTTERNLWAGSYERDLRDVLTLQSDLARAIARAVQGRLTADTSAPAGTRPPVDPAAYDAYLRGIYHLSRRTAEDRKQAVAEFQRAVRRDSLFAAAHARLAYAYLWFGYLGYPGVPPAPAFVAANDAVTEALKLDSLLPEAHLALAMLRWMHDLDLNASERAVQKAVQLNPTLADAHGEYGTLLAIRGRYDAVIVEMERARELDPNSSGRHALVAWAYWLAQRYDDAIRLAQAAIALDSTATTSYQALAGSYDQEGRYAEAVAAAEQGVRRSGGEGLLMAQLGYAYGRAGRTPDARRILAELEAQYRARLASPYFVAHVYIGLGQRDSALTWLETTYKERWGHVVFLAANPAWQPLHSEPRFQTLLRKVGLQLLPRVTQTIGTPAEERERAGLSNREHR